MILKMGSRRSVWCSKSHCCFIVMLIVACLNDSFGVKVVKVDQTQLDETIRDDVPIVENIVNQYQEETTIINWIDVSNYTQTTTVHPHSKNDKPSKFDYDISETIYLDTENSTESQLYSSANKKILCKNGIIMDCSDNDLSTLHDDIHKEKIINATEPIKLIKRIDNKIIKQNESLFDKIHRYARSHTLEINLNKSLFDSTSGARTFFGSFGLKKLMLPLFIGAQIIKSILVALFLPSIIGSIGKIVGKGVSSFAQSSQGNTPPPDENFEFKDNSDLYNDDYMMRQPLGTLPASALFNDGVMMQPSQKPDSRYSNIDARLSHLVPFNDRYYMRHVAQHGPKKQDFKVFHDIPTSSLLLTNYDSFYSPLLSRLDAVFSRLGRNNEGCREYTVCEMYKNPAKYAPYSNLVSAQLSRELNELPRPAFDNTDTTRFFRYMRAAKDGQDGVDCEQATPHCDIPRDDPSLRQNQAMLATYQDIDKLVHARKL